MNGTDMAAITPEIDSAKGLKDFRMLKLRRNS